jgi:hypothetical protein
MEMKENDLLQLRAINSALRGENGKLFGELSGLNLIKSLLKEKEAEINKLNAKLFHVSKGSPINPH